MTPITRTTRLLAAVTACLLAAACGGASTEEPTKDYRTRLQLGTGSTGGTYYPLGGEIATMLGDTVKADGFGVSAVETGASVENMAKIGSGELQLGMTLNGTAAAALNGKGTFEGKQIENFGFVAQLYPEVLHVVTLKSSGIDSIKDLAGKKVAIGPPGSGTNIISRQVLAAHGIEEGEYQPYQEDFGVAAKKLQDGNIAANFAVLGSPAAGVDQLQATTKKVKYLDVEKSARMQLGRDTFYSAHTIPADTYPWLGREVRTIAASSILVASTNQVDKKLGYRITRSLMENADQISHQQGEHLTKENALVGRLDLPLHPGAKKYYQEQGVLD